MATGKRHYWIKLKESFLTSDAVDFLMSQKGGSNYVVLYQMLCVKTIGTNGRLSQKIGEVIIPYDIDKIQRDCKWFSLDTIRVALELYARLGLIYRDQDDMLVITNYDRLVGSETDDAVRMRKSRAVRKQLPPPDVTMCEQRANNDCDNVRTMCEQRANNDCDNVRTMCEQRANNDCDNVRTMCEQDSSNILYNTTTDDKDKSNDRNEDRNVYITTKDKDKRNNRNVYITAKDNDLQNREIKDKHREKDKNNYKGYGIEQSSDCSMQEEKEKECYIYNLPLNDGGTYGVTQSEIDEYSVLYPACDVNQEIRGMIGWLKTNPSRRKTRSGIQRFMNNWLAKAQNDSGGANAYGRMNDDGKRGKHIYDDPKPLGKSDIYV